MLLHKRRTALSFLLSYIILALIPTVMCFGYFYQKATKTIIDNSLSSLQQTTKYSMDNIDDKLATINNIPNMLTKNNQITRLTMENDPLAPYIASGEIKKTIGINPLIEDIYIYVRDKRYFISGYHGFSSVDNARILQGNYGLIYKNWPFDDMIKFFETVGRQTVRPAETAIISGAYYSDMISFIQTIPPGNTFARSTVVILVSGAEIYRLISSSHNPGMQFALFDAKLAPIYTSSGVTDTWSGKMQLFGQTGSSAGEIEIEGKKYLIAWESSLRTGWSFVCTTPLDTVAAPMRQLQREAFFVAIAISLLLSTLVWVFMSINYSPLRKLALLAHRINAHDNEDDGPNHYQAINNAFEKLQQDNSTLSTEVYAVRPRLKELVLQELLNSLPGQINLNKMLANIRDIGIPVDLSTYQVMMLYYADRIKMESDLYLLNEKGYPFILAVLPVMGSTMATILLGDAEKSADLTGGLVGWSGSDDPPFADAWIGAGYCVHSIADIPDSYAKAYIALDYSRMHCRNGAVCLFSDLPESMFRIQSYPLDIMQALSFAILQRDEIRTTSIIGQIAESIQQDASPPYYKRSLFYNAASLILSGLSQDVIDDFLHGSDSHTLLRQQSSNEMAAILTKLAKRYENLISDLKAEQICLPLAEALGFIEQHYSNSSLSLIDVAEHCKMSPSHLSHLFKKKTGCNFKEYVDGLRLDKAKELLRKTDGRIVDIALKVGYNNDYSFSRFFKNKVGVTPKEFRET